MTGVICSTWSRRNRRRDELSCGPPGGRDWALPIVVPVTLVVPVTRLAGVAGTGVDGGSGLRDGSRRRSRPGRPGQQGCRWPVAGGIAAGVAADALLGDP